MRIWTNLAAVIVGLLPSFLAGATVFETGSMTDYLTAFGGIAISFLILGAIFGYLSRTWTTGLWLSVAAVVQAFLFGESLGLSVAVALCAVVAAGLGAASGAKFRATRGAGG